MLEGKEVEGKIGTVGEYTVDVDAQGIVHAGVGIKIDLLEILSKLAAKTGTPIDDAAVAWIKTLLGKV